LRGTSAISARRGETNCPTLRLASRQAGNPRRRRGGIDEPVPQEPVAVGVQQALFAGPSTLANTPPGDDEKDSQLDVTALDKQLESLKWHLWHGNVYRALQIIEDLEWDLESQEERSERARKLLQAVSEFHHYIETNQHSIPNYGDRYRHSETISTAFAELTVNQVISKRMVKKQQMCWTERGAHLLLQVRTQVLNDDLRATFDPSSTAIS
jgi:hypothetical protein